MLDLFRAEVSEQVSILSEKLLELERNNSDDALLEALMRASHSTKGAARMVGVDSIVQIAHVMEDVFVAAQAGKVSITNDDMDHLLNATDKIKLIANQPEEHINQWEQHNRTDLSELLETITGIAERTVQAGQNYVARKDPEKIDKSATSEILDRADTDGSQRRSRPGKLQNRNTSTAGGQEAQRILRVSSEKWNRLMGLTGEVKVETGWLQPYITSMYKVKQLQTRIVEYFDYLREVLEEVNNSGHIMPLLIDNQKYAIEARRLLSDQIAELDVYDRRITSLSARLHKETIETRMRPFSDGVHGYQRMVREIARSLGKKVHFEILGLGTHVDRDVLEKMEAPLNHILRNALDHGIETPEERQQGGKSEQASIIVSAAHKEGMLFITVEDDGRGIDCDVIRRKIIQKGLVKEEMAKDLTEDEILEFLFLPNFSTRDYVTDLSGRGVGLDVVQAVIREIGGNIKISTAVGQGTKFHLQLPLTLSIISALIVYISGEPYAFPLARISRAVKIMADEIEILEGQQYVTLNGEHIGLVDAHQVLEIQGDRPGKHELPVIIVADDYRTYGVVVDEFIGQKELAIQTIDTRLGKLKDISSASLLQDGTPVLIVDVEDMINAIDAIVKAGRLKNIGHAQPDSVEKTKRILVIDDSLTVREVVRKILESKGYVVTTAVDGVDGWNSVRAERYDLIISDIDMPRMNGIELVRKIKSDRSYSSIPVIIISYKDRDEDRQQGMEAGADYYLTKGSFHDEALITAINDLIGET
ncbi:MAG: hypothetical protein A2V90_00930 [Gammaproteobacteria bacterium RBG_16_57_12]|nr:MAG: hypothetical protein A2V90_00930 [Gammaproteobacteria bacterium RBG_16_57_12]